MIDARSRRFGRGIQTRRWRSDAGEGLKSFACITRRFPEFSVTVRARETNRSNRACFVGSDSATATDRTDARRADPDGEYLDIDDVRTTWEEFVDALRDASGVAAAEEEEPASGSPNAYVALETPVMRRNQSFSRLAQDLEEMVVRSQKSSPGSSNAGTPEGSTRGIQRISSRGLLLGVGCSSRDVSARGGNTFYAASTLRSDDVARALEKTTAVKDTA